MIAAYLSGHVGSGNRFTEEVMGRLGIQDGEGQVLVDFAKRIKMAVTNTFFQMRQKLWLIYKSRGTDDVI